MTDFYELEQKAKEKKKLYLPKTLDIANSLFLAYIKNNNLVGLKLAILFSGARGQIEYDLNVAQFNVDTLCWQFSIVLGEPWALLMLPRDTNGDGMRVSNCDYQGIELLSYDSHGMDSSYFRYIINNDIYSG